MILDDDIDSAADIALKAKEKTARRMHLKANLPSSDGFRSEILAFKERVKNTRAVDTYNKMSISGGATAKSVVKPVKIDLQNESHMRLGVRRASRDLDGKTYQRDVESMQTHFRDPVGRNGVVDSFNLAAGLEHQVGRKHDTIVFDKKAV